MSASPIPLTPAGRTQRARLAAHTSWANTADRGARTAPARRNSPGSVEYWLDRVDPDGQMTDEARRLAADSARKAHFARLAYRSAQSRRAKAAARRSFTGHPGDEQTAEPDGHKRNHRLSLTGDRQATGQADRTADHALERLGAEVA